MGHDGAFHHAVLIISLFPCSCWCTMCACAWTRESSHVISVVERCMMYVWNWASSVSHRFSNPSFWSVSLPDTTLPNSADLGFKMTWMSQCESPEWAASISADRRHWTEENLPPMDCLQSPIAFSMCLKDDKSRQCRRPCKIFKDQVHLFAHVWQNM